ncbi:uncharacterized protein LOC143299151 [Babylonia areolata]|uniref:uncharacterized protein LOC143299151 n=1 Tax=Babylonia areolata TaxID=304850 RepID=UPI003FD5740C
MKRKIKMKTYTDHMATNIIAKHVHKTTMATKSPRQVGSRVPMYPLPNSVIYDPPLLCHHVHVHAITRMLFTPSLLETLLNSPDLDLPTAFKTMRQIWFCGEVVTTSLFKRCISTLPWVRFMNLYSVSECHDVACVDLSEYYEKNGTVTVDDR